MLGLSEYPSAISRWRGHSMPIPQRARNILTELEQNDIGGRPIIFLCHSLGGLVVKKALQVSPKRWPKLGCVCFGERSRHRLHGYTECRCEYRALDCAHATSPLALWEQARDCHRWSPKCSAQIPTY